MPCALWSEAGDAGEDDAFVDLAQRLVIDAEPVLHIRTKVLHNHIGLLDHALERREAFWRFQIKRDAALVAVQILKIRPVARTAGPLAFFQVRRRFDLDDIGAPVAELADAGWA
jgi:hypothetical protein